MSVNLRVSEASHQEALFQWLKLHPFIDSLAWHTPNGGFRKKVTAVSFKRQGVKPGVPDVFIAIPNNGYHGLFIELKRKGGIITSLQKEMHGLLTKQNYYVAVSYSWFEARDIILKYLKGTEYVKLRTISRSNS